LACSSGPSPFQVAAADAERAYAHGRYEQAAQRWLAAERRAETSRDRVEARYRAAVSFERAGRQQRARALYKELASGRNDRHERAAYELALIQLERGDTKGGQKLLAEFVARFPDSGLAPQALRRHARWLEDGAGVEAARAYLDGVAARTSLDRSTEHAGFELGRLLEKSEHLAAARDEYLSVARRFSYPRGSLWDDALYRAALIEERLGAYAAATRHLETMLAARESAFLAGSYERPLYDDARFFLARLYRDRLRRPGAARQQFRALWREHPTSTLRDDAIWQEALLARDAADGKAACSLARTLKKEMPESRYAACTALVCRTEPPSTRTCRQYIVERSSGEPR
jgi:TolA-binding protein